MKKQFVFATLLFAAGLAVQAQKPVKPSSAPKLVVGIMVDQMRWDYLYRFQARYGNNGFKRILREGFTCENTYISYAQTVTAAGHASVYTGSVPAINGIMGNEWDSRSLKRDVYCAEDSTVQILGGNGKGEPMSPKNLLTTTVTDELEMATNFRSKVIGVAIKDRGSILPAGHRPDAAYWYESASGNFVTSTWYMKEITPWAKAFNQRRVTDSLYKLNWNLSYPFDTYVQSDLSHPNYTSNPFPRKLEGNVGKNQGAISSTPWGNTLTLAKLYHAVDLRVSGPVSTPKGFYVHRDEHYPVDAMNTAVSLSQRAWTTWEDYWQVKVVGLFRQVDDEQGVAKLNRIVWYPSYEVWQSTRNNTDAQSRDRFRERRQLLIEGSGVAVATNRL